MATVGTGVLNLMDIGKGLDPDGRPAQTIEMLHMVNEIMTDIGWIEGNLPTGHRSTIRTGLPTATWRLLNSGVQPSKGTKAQIDEQCGKLEAWSEVDQAVAELGGNLASTRLDEAKSHIEAMSQGFASTLFYGTAATPEQFIGLAPRYSSLSAGNSQNIVSGGGAGSDNTSIWLVCWGPNTVTGIYPKGSQAGLKSNDRGLQTVTTTAGVGGGRMLAYQEQFVWDCGLALRDWRYAVRIPNIDVSNLVTQSSAADLTKLMIRAVNRIPSFAGVRAAWYMNRTVFEMLDIQRRDAVQTGGQLHYAEVDGVMTPTFRGLPVRRCDSILNTEALVS